MSRSDCTTLSLILTWEPSADDEEEVGTHLLERVRKKKKEEEEVAGSDDQLAGEAKTTVLVEEMAALWAKLDEPLKEMIISKLPVFDFFRLLTVCKKWLSLKASPAFLAACRKVESRPPWFIMIGSRSYRDVAYDAEYAWWRHIKFQGLARVPGRRKLPVAASGGLLCVRSLTGQLAVWNPLTGSTRNIPELDTGDRPLLAIAMQTTRTPSGDYKIVAAYGKAPLFGLKVFSSGEGCWSEEMAIRPKQWKMRRPQVEQDGQRLSNERGEEEEEEDEEGRRHHRRAGFVRRAASKEVSGVMARWEGGGEELIHFVNLRGRVMAFDPRTGSVKAYPEIVPAEVSHSIDIVACRGRMLAVVLRDTMEPASVRVWEFVEMEWRLITSMPRAMCRDLLGNYANINCAGHGDMLMVCISNFKLNRVFICNLPLPNRARASHSHFDSWEELPPVIDRFGMRKRFISACAFEPRIEAVP